MATRCVLVEGDSACEGYATAQTNWYTGLDDQRTCGQCFCEAVGGDCDGTRVQIGSDYSCVDSGNDLASGEKKCFYPPDMRAPYSPSATIIGTPAAPVGCTSDATPAGTATPTGLTTLCCDPL